MTYYILLDFPEFTVNQSITRSRQIMNGHKMDLFVSLAEAMFHLTITKEKEEAQTVQSL
jgi:uncharacterized membrane protein